MNRFGWEQWAKLMIFKWRATCYNRKLKDKPIPKMGLLFSEQDYKQNNIFFIPG